MDHKGNSHENIPRRPLNCSEIKQHTSNYTMVKQSFKGNLKYCELKENENTTYQI